VNGTKVQIILNFERDHYDAPRKGRGSVNTARRKRIAKAMKRRAEKRKALRKACGSNSASLMCDTAPLAKIASAKGAAQNGAPVHLVRARVLVRYDKPETPSG
jgi:hypothetical protein